MRKRLRTWLRNARLPTLLEAARYGDQVAYDELIKRTYPIVLKYVSVYGSRNNSEDLAQETFIRALKSNSFFDAKSVEAFLVHIAKCVCADYVKAQSKTRKINVRYSENLSVTSSAIGSCFEDEYVLLETLEQVNEQYRDAFILTQIVGLSYEQCAELLDIAVGTVRSRVSRARETIQLVLKSSSSF